VSRPPHSRLRQREPAAPLPPAPHALRLPWGDPPTLDPTMANDTTSGGVVAQLFNGLVELGPEMDVVPDVARSWEVSEGGRKYVFHLRDDVRWSDGTPVTAGDFEYAWKRVLNPATGTRNASSLYDVKGARAFHQSEVSDPDQVGVRALDELTLSVELEGPTGYFPQLLAHNAAYPVPRHVVEAHGERWTAVENTVTNGPFRLESWRPGDSMVLVRNSEYHGRFTGNLQRLELDLRDDWSAQLRMYEAGDLDILNLSVLPALEKDRARQRRAGEYVSGPSLSTAYTAFDVSRPPFDDVRVRRAFVLAVDRETLADVVLGGYRFPATGGLVPPGMPGHSPGIGLPYDPEGARQLLLEAGHPGGRGFPPVRGLTNSSIDSIRMSEYLRDRWRDVLGVDITWEILEWSGFLVKLHAETAHMTQLSWIADYTDPDSFLRVAVRLHTKWHDETYDELVEEARRVTDQEQRMKLYQKADRILVEETPILPLTYPRRHLLVKPWMSKFSVSAAGWTFWKDAIIDPH